MIRRRVLLLASVCVLVVGAFAVAQQEKARKKGDRQPGERTAQPAAADKTGLAIGQKAPAFTLRDQNGKERSLSDLLKEDQKLAVIFHRSASW